MLLSATNYSCVTFQTGESRHVKHLQFISWPDYGVPPASGFLDFLLRVRACQADSIQQLEPAWEGHPNGPPLVVHCSAGIGRTGKLAYTKFVWVVFHKVEKISN